MVLKPALQPSAEAIMDNIRSMNDIECGTAEAKKHFAFADGYMNLNHGSFGTYPLAIRPVLRHYQDEAEARPDAFIRYSYPKLLDASREALESYLHAEAGTCVFVPNATTAFNVVLRNLVFEPGDVVVYFATIYGACEKTIEYITETTPATSHKIAYTYPVSDEYLCTALEDAFRMIKAAGKNAKIAVFDTVVSLPGVRMPFERLTAICRANSVMSCVDGAHGIGHIPLDLTALDCDYLWSNCHKWLHVPRGCCVFYVATRNQHLMRSTLPTSHWFLPQPKEGPSIINPLPTPEGKSAFVTNFEFVGTVDNAPYLCIPAALEWRKKVTWGKQRGEDAVMEYLRFVAAEAGRTVASILGTEVLENADRTLANCAFSNVKLPLAYQSVAGGEHAVAIKVAQWIARVLVEEYNTFIAIIFYAEAWWVRLSGQVYLTAEDFEWGAQVLLKVCERVKSGDWTR